SDPQCAQCLSDRPAWCRPRPRIAAKPGRCRLRLPRRLVHRRRPVGAATELAELVAAFARLATAHSLCGGVGRTMAGPRSFQRVATTWTWRQHRSLAERLAPNLFSADRSGHTARQLRRAGRDPEPGLSLAAPPAFALVVHPHQPRHYLRSGEAFCRTTP